MAHIVQGQMTWTSAPKMLRLAEPYVVGVLEDCLQILSVHRGTDSTRFPKTLIIGLCTDERQV